MWRKYHRTLLLLTPLHHETPPPLPPPPQTPPLQPQSLVCCHPRLPDVVDIHSPLSTILNLLSSQIPRHCCYLLTISYNSELVVVSDPQMLLLLTRLQLQFWTCCHPRSPDVFATYSPSATILNLLSSQIIRRCCYSPCLQLQFWTCCHPRSPDIVATYSPSDTILNLLSSQIPKHCCYSLDCFTLLLARHLADVSCYIGPSMPSGICMEIHTEIMQKQKKKPSHNKGTPRQPHVYL